ncbi:MAG: FRG domain-containing protein [Chloroflexia bacterium]
MRRGPDSKRERNLLEQFKREARPYLGFQPQMTWSGSRSDNYGIPTRLIDWSETPLVAAYFVVIEHPTHDGGVYVIRRPEEKQEINRRVRSGVRRTMFFPDITAITAQRGLFTMHPGRVEGLRPQ